MTSTPPTGNTELAVARQATIDRLCERFAEDALSMEDFERRLDLAHRANGPEQLTLLLADFAPAVAQPASRRDAEAPGGGSGPDAHAHAVPMEMVPGKQFVAGVLGASSRGGNWIAPRETYAFAMWGGVELDFREARFGPGVTEVTAFAMWGGVEIIVPPGVQVECNGAGIMGAFVQERDELSAMAARSGDPGAPVLRVNGVALMGGVNVSTRRVGETARDANRRRKLARKARRKELKGW